MNTWHFIVKSNILDDYQPELSSDTPRIYVSLDAADNSLAIKNNIYKVIVNQARNKPSSVVIDLLGLAMSVYTADLTIPRHYTEDRWTRKIILHIPIVNSTKWQTIIPSLETMLEFLTGDSWEFIVRKNKYPPQVNLKKKIKLISKVSLFSGGLDSLIGAIDLLEEGERVALVGHHGAGITNTIQNNVLHQLEGAYPELIEPYLFYVQPPKSANKGEGEASMRSRSFLFLSLAVAVASLFSGEPPIIVAENGLISLNVPLTKSRLGSLSTRTTHPYFISLFCDFVSLLGVNSSIVLPYKFQTKGEMIANVKNQDMIKKTADISMSCSHPEAGRYQGNKPDLHCGYCVPCIIRRASLASVGLDKSSNYGTDILQDPPGHTSDKGRDLRAFEMAIERGRFNHHSQALFDVLKTGKIVPDEVKDYVEVYSRGMKEVQAFLY